MSFADQLLDAVGDVGMDLVDMAEKIRFPKSFLRRTLPVAACMVLLLGVGLYARSYLFAGPAQSQPAAELPAVENSVPEEETPSSEETNSTSEAEEVPMTVLTPQGVLFETQPYYIVEIPGETRRVAAVDAEGAILVQAENVEFITDQASGEYLAILATTEYGADSDWSSAERIVYDLHGQELCRINAKEILCLGDVVAVNYHYGNVALYHRNGTLIQDDLQWAIARSDCIYACPNGAEGTLLFFGPDGMLQIVGGIDYGVQCLNFGDTQEETLLMKWENGQAGLIDLQGEWVVEPLFDRIEVPFHGYVQCRDLAGDWFLVELETGEIVYKIGEEASVNAYADCLLWFRDTAVWVEDWYGNVIIPAASSIQVIDDDGDWIPELFLVEEPGGDYVFCEPNGTERLRIADAGFVYAVSSQTAVYTKTVQEDAGEWMVDFALIDLETGVGIRSFEKPYNGAEPVYLLLGDHGENPGLFYVSYEDAAGMVRMDLMDADGNVVLENLQINEETGEAYLGGGVFRTAGGYQFVDGTWLYRVAE